ncbi:hypothetical protein GCM10012287_07560 [Streptomyces daqingensis]|uniref:Uncharacterized protein n=1 Tax=Streptomyces daqingensis TaxID=1472640 RepID=A0ABQ2LVR2_9ACTN|nr:hypothetical protein GCM10012287_07560 [Streptomyces daqingensis]
MAEDELPRAVSGAAAGRRSQKRSPGAPRPVAAPGGREKPPCMSCCPSSTREKKIKEREESDAIGIARESSQSARVPQTPDWKVVHGPATAIPAFRPSGPYAVTQEPARTAGGWC